ncbi:MAG: penicillin-binding protein 1C [Alphaproteobacteria bacterium]|nr:penicillin-binding protein 1C [Alphaproteobacteria bacterium]
MPRRAAAWAGVSAALVAAVAALVWCLLLPPALDRSRDLSALVLARDGSILRGFLSAEGSWRLPVEPAAVDPLYRQMLVAAEDRRFWRHPGVDPIAALRAIGQMIEHGRVVSGASTLTMQVVRLLERRRRTLPAKLAEMGEALALERRADKEQVLGLYLTLAPFGGNLEGIRAASLAWFGKEPAHLTAAEAALLVAIPRSPERLRPDRHPEAARAARNAVLRRMAANGVISEAAYAEARDEAVPRQRLPMPFLMPHLARALREAAPGFILHRTAIDPLLQRQAEAVLAQEAAGLGPHATVAALIVDNRDRRVLAYVGNADFADPQRRGTLDMVRAVRSPGSTLKPFIYAMAFDRLLLHPATILDDRPRHFGDYAPTDFDGRFQGEVTAREALQYSLNVPAVAVLDRLGPERFMAALGTAGIRLHLPDASAEPGLALALGGVGITLADLATLYVGLANKGAVAPLRYRLEDAAAAPTAIFGPVAAWYVEDVLADAPPPPGILPAEFRRGRHLAFKTGTSYGYRDAWAVGWNAERTIAVWAGRADGSPMPGRSGRLTAAPVLFKLADLLPPGMAGGAGPPPAGALIAGSRDLPPALRRLDPGPHEGGADGEPAAPKILYPPDGALVEWQGKPLPLEAAGGKRPLRWLVDGRPLPPQAPRRTMYWQPAEIGFTRLTVIDAAGRSASATVRLAP